MYLNFEWEWMRKQEGNLTRFNTASMQEYNQKTTTVKNTKITNHELYNISRFLTVKKSFRWNRHILLAHTFSSAHTHTKKNVLERRFFNKNKQNFFWLLLFFNTWDQTFMLVRDLLSPWNHMSNSECVFELIWEISDLSFIISEC